MLAVLARRASLLWVATAVLASIGASVLAAGNPAPPTVLVPTVGEKAYAIAGEALVDLWDKVTGQRLKLLPTPRAVGELPPGDVVLLGSDAVQPIVHELIRSGALESLGLQYGGDSYRLLTLQRDGRRYLILAGGSGRSTLYAVYDFFRRQAGVQYFWDGDVIPKRPAIDYAGLDVLEKPRFPYRGLRYFAHRGLHRFQAEHWDFEDWKREIDWLVKERFNLFMLRIGIDDLFQRAFPELPYPPTDGPDPDALPRSYDDRTSFWALKYRGQLRKAVLQYAFDRGLLHPEDTGTITHWYSHTPSSFYRSHPDFPVIRDQTQGYTLPSAAIWDIEHQETWEAYWRLTQTHIREFGQPRLFHTIGMAERRFGKSERDNLQRKLYVYRKIQQKLREHYPDAPLLIASWDFVGWWKDADVRRLLDEFDPQRTIVLEYTADNANKLTFEDWGLRGRFPWIFGIFHGFARNSDTHEDYGILAERLQKAAADSQCHGLVTWSEISHSDTFLLEYLAENSWRPEGLDAATSVARYCKARYAGGLESRMKTLWERALPAIQALHWSLGGPGSLAFDEPQFRVLSRAALVGMNPDRQKIFQREAARLLPGLRSAPVVLAGLAELSESSYADPHWRRDALDLGRTLASRVLLMTILEGCLEAESWRKGTSGDERVRKLARLSQEAVAALADLLAQSDDFSMAASLQRLRAARPLGGVQPTVNPHSEQTLKGNAENDYCRSHHYELVRHVYQEELAAYWKWVLGQVEAGQRKPWKRPAEFGQRAKEIREAFYARPLAEMAPRQARTAAQLAASLRKLEGITKDLLLVIASQ